jgi:hypothetical protein
MTELYTSKRKVLLFVALALAIAAGSVFIATHPSTRHSEMRVWGWIGAAVVGLGGPLWVRELFMGRPRVRISDAGIEDVRSTEGIITWPEITSARITGRPGGRFLALALRDPDARVERLRVRHPWTARFVRVLGSSDVNIGLELLEASPAEVLALVQEHLTR